MENENNYEIVPTEVELLNVEQIDWLEGGKLFLETRSAETKVVIEDGITKVKVGNNIEEKYEDYLKNCLKMNLQFNNFINLKFRITGSLLIRDFLYSFNETSQWAYSTRNSTVIKNEIENPFKLSSDAVLEEGTVPNSILDSIDLYKNACKSAVENNNSDEALLYQPYWRSNTYYWGCTLKQLLVVLKLMEDKFPVFFNSYGKNILSLLPDYVVDIYYEISDKLSHDQLYSKYLFQDQWNGSYKIGKMGLILYSQFIRQSGGYVRGLFDYLLSLSDIRVGITGKVSFPIEYWATSSRINTNIMHRSCWS